MNEYLSFALLGFTSFFTLVNPVGVMPVYMTMTADLTDHDRAYTARKAVTVAFLTMLLFAFSGQLLFKFFGISVDAFRVVGGVIFFLVGNDMLHARLVRTQIDPQYKKKHLTDISITPLGIPMICGPGAITNSIVLMEDARDFEMKLILVGVIALVLAIMYFTLLGASRVIKLLGDTGNTILMRIMGLIIMVIAVEFFVSGIRPILREILKIQ